MRLSSSAFLENSPVYGASQADERVFVVRRRSVPDRLDEGAALAGSLEPLPDRLKIIVVVGSDPQSPGYFEDAQGLFEKTLVEQAALVVFLLRPGIQKIDVEGVDGPGGQEELDELTGVTVDEAKVGKTPLQSPVMSQSQVLPRHLDADEVVLWSTLRRVEQEAPLAKAEFNLDGMVVCEDRCHVQDWIFV